MRVSVIVNNQKHGNVIYLSNTPKKIKLLTWLKFKQMIYGKIFTYYNSEMDFSNSSIIYDNRLNLRSIPKEEIESNRCKAYDYLL